MSDLQPIGQYFSLIGDLQEFAGTCEIHGDSVIRVLKFMPAKGWYCTTCWEAKMKQEEEEKQRAERKAILYRCAHLPAKYVGQRFAAKTAAQKTIRITCKAFLDSLAKNRLWAVLVLMGGVGTGKTLLATELAESMINNMGISVRYCTAKQMISEIQSSYSTEGKTEEGEILRFVQYGVLVIDEIDAKPDSPNANLLLTEVINRRYNELRPVIVITNQPFDSLAQYVGDRVESRLNENAMVCAFTWPDFRKQPILEARLQAALIEKYLRDRT